MSNVAVFIGVSGGGKDYQANLLADKGYKKLAFKDALLEMCSDLVGYDVTEDYDWFKEHLIGFPNKSDNDTHEYCGMKESDLRERYPNMMTGRRLLQRLGTEVMRKRDKNYWSDQWYRNAVRVLDNNGDIANSDCRFPNEVESARRLHDRDNNIDIRFIFCDHHSKRYNPGMEHQSEFLAQALLKMGARNGEELSFDQVDDACVLMNDRISKLVEAR